MTTQIKTTYTIREHATGQAIGEITLTPEQFARYESESDGEECVCHLSDLPGKIDDMSIAMGGTTPVYLD